MSNSLEKQQQALVIVEEKGFFKRIVDEIQEPLSSTLETTEKLTANVIISSAQTVDLGMTSVNLLVEGFSSATKHSTQALKRLDIDGVLESFSTPKSMGDK